MGSLNDDEKVVKSRGPIRLFFFFFRPQLQNTVRKASEKEITGLDRGCTMFKSIIHVNKGYGVPVTHMHTHRHVHIHLPTHTHIHTGSLNLFLDGYWSG